MYLWRHEFSGTTEGLPKTMNDPSPAQPPEHKPKLLDQVRMAIRPRHYSIRTEEAYVQWIRRVAVNHWAAEAMVTQDVDFVVAAESVDLATRLLDEAGFRSERFQWSINFRGRSKVSIQLSTEDFYKDFPSRSVPADIHGMLMRVASLEDTLRGKIKAWRDTEGRQSKKLKDLGDVARLVESHPHLWELLDPGLKEIIQKQ